MSQDDKTNEKTEETHKIELSAKSQLTATATVERLHPLREILSHIIVSAISVGSLVLANNFLLDYFARYIQDEKFSIMLSYAKFMAIILSLALGIGSVFTSAFRLYRRRLLLREQAVMKLRSTENAFFQRIDSDVTSLLRERS